ncbi:TniQ family protein [Terasakiella sp.]|uniref:TniQ family protein n=1 Tax=Terasakiella sp. TaxID=2034861 RepID=UPI003AA8B728
MTFSRSLLFKSPPIQNESLVGYLIRIAELNRYPRMSWIGNLAGVTLTEETLSKMGTHLDNLAKVVGVPAAEMKSLCYYVSAKGNNSHVVLSMGEIISKQYFYWPSERVCFSCLREKGFISGLWDLKAVTHCPEHGEMLRKACPVCKEPVTFNRGRLAPCLPGCQYSGEGRECSDSVRALMQLISNKFLGTEFDLAEHGFPKQIVDSDLYTLLQTISFLAMRSWRGEGDIDHGWLDARPETVIERMTHTSGALVNWPFGYFKFLDGICAGKGAPDGAIVMHWMFGGFYKNLVSQKWRLQFLLDGLQDYVSYRLNDQVLPGRECPPQPKKRDRWIYTPSFIACKQLGLGYQEFRRLIGKHYLQNKTFNTSYGEMVCVHRDSMQEYLETRIRLVERKELADELGLSLHSLYSLSVANILNAFHSPEKDAWPKWWYDRQVVDEWLDSLREKAKPPAKGKRTIQLSQAVAKYNHQGLTYSKLFNAINQGALRLYRRRLDAENLLSYFHLDEAQLSKWYLEPG